VAWLSPRRAASYARWCARRTTRWRRRSARWCGREGRLTPPRLALAADTPPFRPLSLARQLRGAVTSWLLADGGEGASFAPPLPPYLRAKLAQLFAALVAADAPSGAWAAPLAPLLGALSARGAPAAPPLFAALEALHEDVLSLEFGAHAAAARKRPAQTRATRRAAKPRTRTLLLTHRHAPSLFLLLPPPFSLPRTQTAAPPPRRAPAA
jgi:hypothetical protein